MGKEAEDLKNSMPVSFGILISKKIRSTGSRSRRDWAFKGLSASPTISKKEISSIYSFNTFLATGSSSTIMDLNFITAGLGLLRRSHHEIVSLIHACRDKVIPTFSSHLQFLFLYDQ